jgi:hypothetical protein
MKLRNLFLLSILIVSLVTACGQQQNNEQDIAVAVAAVLTQTAAAPKPTASPTPAPVNGTITGKVGIMAPPTPAMVVYALDPVSGKYASVETSANANMADFSLSVPPGSYQVFAVQSGPGNSASAGYSSDGQALSLVTVASNQTVNDIMVQFPGQGDCGFSFGLPDSPDGKYKGLPGPNPACIANMKTTEAAAAVAPGSSSTPTRVQFEANTSSWGAFGDLKGGESTAFVLYALKGQTMTVTANFEPSTGAYFYVRTAQGRILLPSSTASWSAVLPGSQDYVVGIDNLTQQATHFNLTISIPPAAAPSVKPTTVTKSGYGPVSAAVCQTLQELANNALSTSFAMQASAPFTNPLSQESGMGCTLTARGTGAQYSDVGKITADLAKGFLGWDEQVSYQASGPTGSATAMTRDMGLLLIKAEWAPAAGITCPGDKPISECSLTPEQKIYSITIQAAQK